MEWGGRASCPLKSDKLAVAHLCEAVASADILDSPPSSVLLQSALLRRCPVLCRSAGSPVLRQLLHCLKGQFSSSYKYILC